MELKNVNVPVDMETYERKERLGRKVRWMDVIDRGLTVLEEEQKEAQLQTQVQN